MDVCYYILVISVLLNSLPSLVLLYAVVQEMRSTKHELIATCCGKLPKSKVGLNSLLTTTEQNKDKVS